MRKVTHRSYANVNNGLSYSPIDRDLDRALPGHTAGHARKVATDDRPEGPSNISTVIGRSPRRLTLVGNGPKASVPIRVRVYGESYLGLALSRASLLTLVEKGYLDADTVRIKGLIEGQAVEEDIAEEDFDQFKRACGF